MVYLIWLELHIVVHNSGDDQDGPVIKNVITPDYPFTKDELDSLQFTYLCINNNMTVQSIRIMKTFIEMILNRNKTRKSR